MPFRFRVSAARPEICRHCLVICGLFAVDGAFGVLLSGEYDGLRHFWAEQMEVHSAGVTPVGVDPRAVRVMAEAGVDISDHWSKALHEFDSVRFDVVVTVCDHAREVCPVPPCGARHLHVGFDDPPSLTAGIRDQELRLEVYRRVRDEIREFVLTLPEALGQAESLYPSE